MFEIEIIWWKIVGDLDPDQTPWWDEKPNGLDFTMRQIVDGLIKVFWKRQCDDAVQTDTHCFYSAKLERPGDPSLGGPWPDHGDSAVVPAVRLWFKADRDPGGSSNTMGARILKEFGRQYFTKAADFVPADEWLASALGASVAWKDDRWKAFCGPDGKLLSSNMDEPPPEDVWRVGLEKLLDMLPEYLLTKAAAGR